MNTNQIQEQDKSKDFQVNANGFIALNPRDGFRQDNKLWFAQCSECGETITNSAFDGFWTHRVYSEKGYYSKESLEKDLIPNFSSSRSVDYCPKVANIITECEVWYEENGTKILVN